MVTVFLEMEFKVSVIILIALISILLTIIYLLMAEVEHIFIGIIVTAIVVVAASLVHKLRG